MLAIQCRVRIGIHACDSNVIDRKLKSMSYQTMENYFAGILYHISSLN